MDATRTQDTVGRLIEEKVRVTRYCETCKDHGEVDLERIRRAKGDGYLMLDHLPLCTNGTCMGMIRFKAQLGMRGRWLMTAKGDERYQAHGDWMFTTRNLAIKRHAQLERRKRQSRPMRGAPRG